MDLEEPVEDQVSRTAREALAAFREGDRFRAWQLANAAIESGARQATLFHLRGLCNGIEEKYEDALGDFRSACAQSPHNPVLLEATGQCLTMLGRPGEAIAAFEEALVIRPDFVRAYFRKGIAHGLLNETDRMREAHERVVALEPRNADALASLALIAARGPDPAGARAFAMRALECSPEHGIALVSLAMADIEQGEFSAAYDKLARVLQNPCSARDGRLNIALGFAADALDRHGHYPEASRLYGTVNDRRREIHAARFADRRAIDDLLRLSEFLGRQEPWPRLGHLSGRGPDIAGHVFLLGFVRSGTTLLETVLASHPLVAASDERDFLADAANYFLHDAEGLDRLASLGEREATSWLNSYWKGVAESGLPVEHKILLDKVPLNSLRLPLIARLFPDAKVLLAIRDPRDVVLSAFRHRFNMYPASFEFLRIDDCARFYAALMHLVEITRRKSPFLRVHELRYEDLVSDFARSLDSACSFVGIGRQEQMREFRSAASVIDRRSQSAAQVRRGLYQGAAGRWRHYRESLETAMPVLLPWIERFGYARE